MGINQPNNHANKVSCTQRGGCNCNQRNSIRVSDAVIDEITSDSRNWFVTITYRDTQGSGRGQNQTVRLVVSRDTRILDENGRNIPPNSLERGMIVDAVFSSAWTMSIPPQAQAFQIRVVSRPRRSDVTVGRVVQNDCRNQFIMVLTNNNSRVRFNVNAETRIVGPFGIPLTICDLIPGLQVRVEHATFMTASIPPQTTAFVIQVIH